MTYENDEVTLARLVISTFPFLILIGLVGGAVWNFFGGIRNAPAGSRMSQAIARMKARTPLLGGI